MKKNIYLFFLLCFVMLSALVFRPISIPNSIDQCVKVEGVVAKVFEGSSYDVNLRLEGDNHKYYINRGLQKGLQMDALEHRLIGKKVTFYYPNHWTPLDPSQMTHHLSQVDIDKEVIFTEIDG